MTFYLEDIDTAKFKKGQAEFIGNYYKHVAADQ